MICPNPAKVTDDFIGLPHCARSDPQSALIPKLAEFTSIQFESMVMVSFGGMYAFKNQARWLLTLWFPLQELKNRSGVRGGIEKGLQEVGKNQDEECNHKTD